MARSNSCLLWHYGDKIQSAFELLDYNTTELHGAGKTCQMLQVWSREYGDQSGIENYARCWHRPRHEWRARPKTVEQQGLTRRRRKYSEFRSLYSFTSDCHDDDVAFLIPRLHRWNSNDG